MPKVKETSSKKKSRPMLTPEARENQMIALAEALAEKQLREGTASSQVISHYLKLGSSKERLERENMELDKELKKAKTENLRAATKTEEEYREVILALKKYSGYDEEDEEDEDSEIF